MTEKFRICDVVKVKVSGRVGVLIEVQYKHDRYHMRGLSGWQYGIDDLEKVEIDTLLTKIEFQKEEIAELREREYNHYPIVILDLETRIFKLQDDLEAAHDALEMLPPKDVEIHERTQFQIDKTVDRILIESLQKEIKRLQWAASNAFDNLNQLKSDDVEEAKQFLYKALTESKI